MAFQVHNSKVFSTYHPTVGCWLWLVAARLSASLQTMDLYKHPMNEHLSLIQFLEIGLNKFDGQTDAQSAKSVMQLSMQQTGCNG
ncbi:hypothetical protein K456DRAFT_1135895 [Colletotrichum gloeosporioides 23]|nr:hypothetical protein K456DRAFT_1135895 [Colletotrichum gloeosporioides 23]